MNEWSLGDTKLRDIPFTGTPGFNLKIPANANKLIFFYYNYFWQEKLLIFLHLNQICMPLSIYQPTHRIWKKSLYTWGVVKMELPTTKWWYFLALTIFMGMTRTGLLQYRWLSTCISTYNYVQNGIWKYHGIPSLLCNNADYIKHGQPHYNKKKTLGKALHIMVQQWSSVWKPCRHISIDEGIIPFKGRILLKVYNPDTRQIWYQNS